MDPEHILLPENRTPLQKLKDFYFSYTKKIHIGLGVLAALFLFYFFLSSPPSGYPSNEVFIVPSGVSLQEVTKELYTAHIIRSRIMFQSLVILFGGERTVVAGDYFLKWPQSVFVLAYRFSHGKTDIEPIKITIPEGWSVREMAEYFKTRLPLFDTVAFVAEAEAKEGYLFPDTYFVSPLIRPGALIVLMENNFEDRIASLPGVKTSGKKLTDIVTMASILEDEGRTMDSRQVISGILWKRLSLGMPLQVDSTIAYVTHKTLPELTPDDLKINSPYNTYMYKGLPPGPIGNPGLDALEAALTPIASQYVYYISDKDGDMHYAKTFEEHKDNIAKYLKK